MSWTLKVSSVVVFIFGLLNLANALPLIPGYPYGSLCSTTDTDFVEFRYEEGIPYCERNVSSHLKDYIYDLYQIPEQCRHKYTIDHTVPLALGGNNSLDNLWPEHVAIKATRRNLELDLYYQLLRGEVHQQEAINQILAAKNNPQVIGIQLDPADPCDKL